MKAGFISVVGRPNVGKSTLINKLVGDKVSIVSDKSGTTRENIKGILNINDNQYIFIDTPGIHKPRNFLGEYMTNSALKSLNDSNVILFILDGKQDISSGDIFIKNHLDLLKNTPKILCINKIDTMSDEEIENKKLEVTEKLGHFDGLITISGKYYFGISDLIKSIDPYLDDNIKYYPEDMYTDMSVYRIICEIIREKILIETRDEIPHSVAIEIINVKQNENGKDNFDINIYVERDSQKGIIIGKNGSMLKKIGIESRKEIEKLLDRKIYLNLWVKVKEDWRKKKPFLKDMGYTEE